MPLKSGYSHEVFSANVREMVKSGHNVPSASAASYAAARVAFFKRYPQGALPVWLAYPRKFRMKQHYGRNGEPIQIIHARLRSNPSPRTQDAEIRQGARLMQQFSGHRMKSITRIKRDKISPVRVAIGPVLGIIYSTRRDGKQEKYIHRFAANSRPLLSVSPDGKRIELLGGAFKFTERGIVDHKG